MANETPSRPPPFMANALLNFHFDYWHTSLTNIGFVMENIYSFTIIEFQTYKLRCKLKFNVTCKVKVFSLQIFQANSSTRMHFKRAKCKLRSQNFTGRFHSFVCKCKYIKFISPGWDFYIRLDGTIWDSLRLC